MLVELPPLSDAEVAAQARPGESWEQARSRLELARAMPGEVKPRQWVPPAPLPRLSPEQLEALWQHDQRRRAGWSPIVELRAAAEDGDDCP